MATCPECEFDEIDTEDLEEGDTLSCPECGKSLVMTGCGRTRRRRRRRRRPRRRRRHEDEEEDDDDDDDDDDDEVDDEEDLDE